jgi:hypothetical protein
MADQRETGAPLRRPDAIRAGASDWDLRHRHVALFRGVHIDGSAPITLRLRIDAALLVVAPGSYVSHHTAALLWGGIVPDHADVHITSPRNRTRRTGIAAHRTKAAQQVVDWRGLRLTSAAQTFLDLAQLLGLVDLVALGDSLVKAGRTSTAELIGVAAGAAGPHSRPARRAAALVRAGVDSAMETRVRLLLVLAGLPEPAVDHRVRDEQGRTIRRFDLSYPQWGLVIEYDGRQHAMSTSQWQADIARDEQLDDWGVRRLVIVARDVYGTPAHTLARVVKAMRSVGMPVPRLVDEWRRHFPSRPGDLGMPV